MKRRLQSCGACLKPWGAGIRLHKCKLYWCEWLSFEMCKNIVRHCLSSSNSYIWLSIIGFQRNEKIHCCTRFVLAFWHWIAHRNELIQSLLPLLSLIRPPSRIGGPFHTIKQIGMYLYSCGSFLPILHHDMLNHYSFYPREQRVPYVPKNMQLYLLCFVPFMFWANCNF